LLFCACLALMSTEAGAAAGAERALAAAPASVSAG
jgi:hypothetical protein